MDVQHRGSVHGLAAAGRQPARVYPVSVAGLTRASLPLNATRAHYGVNFYFRPCDTFIRQQYGEPESAEDYCMKAHLVTAEHHRAVSEAVNHCMWDITSGSWERKINFSFPDFQWQIHDWYLRPMVSLYYYRLAFEPLHLQYSYLDRTVTLLNQSLQPRNQGRPASSPRKVISLDGAGWKLTGLEPGEGEKLGIPLCGSINVESIPTSVPNDVQLALARVCG